MLELQRIDAQWITVYLLLPGNRFCSRFFNFLFFVESFSYIENGYFIA